MFRRHIIHLFIRTRQWKNKKIKKLAKQAKGLMILEIGSGDRDNNGRYDPSLIDYFQEDNHFMQSDIEASYGHNLIDVEDMDFESEFDLILCTSVFEHLYYPKQATINLYHALKPNGRLILFVPFMWPLHDEPSDYHRYTEHCLDRMLYSFNRVEISHYGLRRCPFAYFVEAFK